MLYNRSVYWNNSFDREIKRAIKTCQYCVSHHAKERIESRKISYNKLLVGISKSAKITSMIIECTIENNEINHFLVRFPYDKYFDVVVGLYKKDGRLIIATAWKNARTDKHETLQKENYATF